MRIQSTNSVMSIALITAFSLSLAFVSSPVSAQLVDSTLIKKGALDDAKKLVEKSQKASGSLIDGASAKTSKGSVNLNPKKPDTPIKPAESVKLTGDELKFWRLNWSRVAKQFAYVDGKYYPAFKFNPLYPSSAGITVKKYIDENSETKYASIGGNLKKKTTSKPPLEEAIAAVGSIRTFRVGEYGHINSARVDQVRGPYDMIVSNIWLVDTEKIQREIKSAKTKGQAMVRAENARIAAIKRKNEQMRRYDRYDRNGSGSRGSVRRSSSSRQRLSEKPRITAADVEKAIQTRYKARQEAIKLQTKFEGVRLRLIGFATSTAAPGLRWSEPGLSKTGAQIVIVQQVQSKSSKSRRSTSKDFIAVNAKYFKATMKEEHFVGLIKEADMTPAEFVVVARELMRSNTKGSIPAIVSEIQQRRLKNIAAAEAITKSTDEGLAKSGVEKKTSGNDYLKKKYAERERQKAQRNAEKKSGGSDYLKKKYAERERKKTEKKSTGGSDFLKNKYNNEERKQSGRLIEKG